MDNRPALNPAIALAVLASSDHTFYADGQGPTVHPFEPIPHEDFVPTVADDSVSSDSMEHLDEESKREIAGSTVRTRELAEIVA